MLFQNYKTSYYPVVYFNLAATPGATPGVAIFRHDTNVIKKRALVKDLRLMMHQEQESRSWLAPTSYSCTYVYSDSKRHITEREMF